MKHSAKKACNKMPCCSKQYVLADKVNRAMIDLSEFKEVIQSIVTSVIPGAEVKVESEGYSITTAEGCISNGDVRKIGRRLAQTNLGKFTMYKPSLFISVPSKQKPSDEAK